jgi:hypothetical protein
MDDNHTIPSEKYRIDADKNGAKSLASTAVKIY